MAQGWGVEYIETSAKTNFNCKEAFEKMAQKIVELKCSAGPEKNVIVVYIKFWKVLVRIYWLLIYYKHISN